ncbi:MAG: type II toxin-antitoxin system HicB family antitoxin [Hyphomicrobiaceae bacterium]|nr:MAG: type II toxin-antitoxin system HicB family antitoxin [Hyphomicrobiaceae bacterium]
MKREFTVIVERDEDGFYVASVPALAGCHTQARSLDDLMQRIQEAIAVCLEDSDGAALPTLEFVGVQRVTVAA